MMKMGCTPYGSLESTESGEKGGIHTAEKRCTPYGSLESTERGYPLGTIPFQHLMHPLRLAREH